MRKIINIILVAIIIVCLSIIGYKYYNYNKDDKLNSEIQDLQPVINEASDSDNNSSGENDGQDQSKEGNYVNSANEEELKSINSDYKMWIQIENTNINYPVVQGSDNDYYLKHNFRKESNISGTVFGNRNTIFIEILRENILMREYPLLDQVISRPRMKIFSFMDII